MKIIIGLICLFLGALALIDNKMTMGLIAVIIGFSFIIRSFTAKRVSNDRRAYSNKRVSSAVASSIPFVGGTSTNSSNFGDGGCGGGDGGGC
jgi:uncharacterized membrane protein HdeD (DUF308 family)